MRAVARTGVGLTLLLCLAAGSAIAQEADPTDPPVAETELDADATSEAATPDAEATPMAAATPEPEPPPVPTDIAVADTPNDGGRSVTLTWTGTPDGAYTVDRAIEASGPWTSLGAANCTCEEGAPTCSCTFEDDFEASCRMEAVDAAHAHIGLVAGNGSPLKEIGQPAYDKVCAEISNTGALPSRARVDRVFARTLAFERDRTGVIETLKAIDNPFEGPPRPDEKTNLREVWFSRPDAIPDPDGRDAWDALLATIIAADPEDPATATMLGDSFAELVQYDETHRRTHSTSAYQYRLTAQNKKGGASVSSAVVSGTPAVTNLFVRYRWMMVVLEILVIVSVIAFIAFARRGMFLFVRTIPGLAALEEAVGRATEMGKPVLYIPGIEEAMNIQTIYSMVILGYVAKIVARYNTPLIVPTGRAFVQPMAEEAVKQGYLAAGRPEAFNPNNVRYLSDEQFAFTAAANGIILREEPAACIYLGGFYAESLLLAETGFSINSIQIAGTTYLHQLPFFIVACDYTLIGEEFYAATAYIGRDPTLLGTLKAIDFAKLLIMIVLILFTLLISISPETFGSLPGLFATR